MNTANVPAPMSASPAYDLVLAERYRLVEAGPDRGMGETWKVLDQRRENAPLSMKFLRAGEGDEIPPAVLAAIHALTPLRHGAVPTLLNSGIHARRPWVVFDDVQGVSLGTLLERARAGGELPDLGLLRSVFGAVAGAIQAAHAAPRPFTHGTLSPGSVIVLPRPVRGVPCALLDLGLMEWLDPPSDALARSARFLVVPAPEVLKKGAVTTATDVFALGALLTEALALPAPLGATLAAVTEERHRPDVPAGVWEVLSVAMARAPGERFETIAAFMAALESSWQSPVASRAHATPVTPPSSGSMFETVAPVARGPSLEVPSTPRIQAQAAVLEPLPISPPAPGVMPPVHAAPAARVMAENPEGSVPSTSASNPWSTQVLQQKVSPGVVADYANAPMPQAEGASDMGQTLVDLTPRAFPARERVAPVGSLKASEADLGGTLIAGPFDGTHGAVRMPSLDGPSATMLVSPVVRTVTKAAPGSSPAAPAPAPADEGFNNVVPGMRGPAMIAGLVVALVLVALVVSRFL